MKLLITRPEEDAANLTRRLEQLGHEVEAAPLISIVPRQKQSIPDEPYQLIVITSANALRTPNDFNPLKSVLLYAVGAQSLAQAQKSGFKKASAHGGDVHGLVRHIQKTLKPEDGPILYLSGAETSADLEGLLKVAGYQTTRLMCYDAVPQPLNLTPEELNTFDGVLLYSPRTAKLWVAEVNAANLSKTAEDIIHFCLSANVAANLPQSWRKKIAKHAHEAAMLDLLDQSTINE
jgi:uroporphyrinogen-III synthase